MSEKKAAEAFDWRRGIAEGVSPCSDFVNGVGESRSARGGGSQVMGSMAAGQET